MTRRVAWAVREGFVRVGSLSAGTEMSLVEFLGSTVLIFEVLALCLKYLYPLADRSIERHG
jgi:hypothetical protein